MGQAASIRQDKTPLTKFCKSNFNVLAKRGLFAFSRGSRRLEKCEVQLKHTAPHKLSRVEKSIHSPTCKEVFLDDDEIEEIIRKICYSDDSGIVRRQWHTLSSVTSST
uniref:DUF3399 domain-containing protein n=1 Tax=Mesocestoides corti TaxID=53468 RepID=A0A5K3FVV2_MESCO